jgi:hypothetical protein
MTLPSLRKLSALFQRRTLPVCSAIALFTAIVPFARAFFHLEVDYNEGWNIYNAETIARHQLLYPARFGWTSVNYPMLSFYLFGHLHRFTHDFLFTARIVSLLSLLASSLLIGLIVHRLTAHHRAAILSGLFCLALFCANADLYVGMDDPQLLAHAVFLSGLLLYLHARPIKSLAQRSHPLLLVAATLLFVIAGSIKHNPIDVPFAVLLDLLFLYIPSALLFAASGLVFTAVAVYFNIHLGGPFFIAQLLTPRTYIPSQVPEQFLVVLGPILLPFLCAAYTAWTLRRDPSRRIAALLLLTSILIGGAFSGGSGVTINALFSTLFATAILLGLFWAQLSTINTPSLIARISTRLAAAPNLLFLWLIIPLLISGNWNPIATLRDAATQQRHFQQDVAALRNHPGPALCESLLECHEAGKAYLYDPFNATRLIGFHKLDESALITQIQHHHFAVIQTDDPLPREDTYNSERFSPAVRSAIETAYFPALEDPTDPRDPNLDAGHHATLYLPKPSIASTSTR